jgi:flagellar basal-body rod protein FlgB
MSWLDDPIQRTLSGALDGLALRESLIASNLANIDTPGYAPRSVAFEAALQAALAKGEAGAGAMGLQETQAKAGIGARSAAKYGKSLGTAAVDATYRRNMARAAKRSVASKPAPPGTQAAGAAPTPDYGEAAYRAAQDAAAAGGGQGGFNPWVGLQPGETDTDGRLVTAPDEPYTAAGEKVWTPQSARAWWDAWFQNPTNLSGLSPQNLPGSLVLSPEEAALARQINTRLGPRPENASGQNPGYRPGDTSINNSYDVLAYLAELQKQQAAGTYKSVNPLVAGRPDEAQLNAAELERAIAAAQATIAANKDVYAIQLALQQAASGLSVPDSTGRLSDELAG